MNYLQAAVRAARGWRGQVAHREGSNPPAFLLLISFLPPSYKNSRLMNDSISSRQMGHSPPPPLPPPEARSTRVQGRHSTLQGGEKGGRGEGRQECCIEAFNL